MSLLHSLRVRYARDDIYTFVGPILISINPYKKIPNFFNEEKMVCYHKSPSHKATPPHIFVIAEAAYTSLMLSVSKPAARNQAIVISGESGAGKTESTKVIMSYLAKITLMNNLSKSSSIGELEQLVLNTNPILEAFGNAKTLRNDNSSRFGKFIKIQFDQTGRIVGAVIEKYLLEKTRVQHQLEVSSATHYFPLFFRWRFLINLTFRGNEIFISSISCCEEFRMMKRPCCSFEAVWTTLPTCPVGSHR